MNFDAVALQNFSINKFNKHIFNYQNIPYYLLLATYYLLLIYNIP